jgi:hypothetical protein
MLDPLNIYLHKQLFGLIVVNEYNTIIGGFHLKIDKNGSFSKMISNITCEIQSKIFIKHLDLPPNPQVVLNPKESTINQVIYLNN